LEALKERKTLAELGIEPCAIELPPRVWQKVGVWAATLFSNKHKRRLVANIKDVFLESRIEKSLLNPFIMKLFGW
jgi:hypothetical protein